MKFPGTKRKEEPEKPTSAADWRERVVDLQAQAEQARQVLEQKRAARRDAAGRVIVFGQSDDSVNALVEQERELQRSVGPACFRRVTVTSRTATGHCRLPAGPLFRGEVPEKA